MSTVGAWSRLEFGMRYGMVVAAASGYAIAAERSTTCSAVVCDGQMVREPERNFRCACQTKVQYLGIRLAAALLSPR